MLAHSCLEAEGLRVRDTQAAVVEAKSTPGRQLVRHWAPRFRPFRVSTAKETYLDVIMAFNHALAHPPRSCRLPEVSHDVSGSHISL